MHLALVSPKTELINLNRVALNRQNWFKLSAGSNLETLNTISIKDPTMFESRFKFESRLKFCKFGLRVRSINILFVDWELLTRNPSTALMCLQGVLLGSVVNRLDPF